MICKKDFIRSWGRCCLPLILCLGFCRPLCAQSEVDKHQLENMTVTIPATAYKNGKFLSKEQLRGKDYIMGKSSSYDKSGKAYAGTLLQPGAEYLIRSGMPGGSYNVTVYYTIDEKVAPEVPTLRIGFNSQPAQEVEIKNKLVNSVKVSFHKVNLIKGKQHTVKLWFPTAGVKVREIKITKALLPKKK